MREAEDKEFGWAILELMGHRRLAGLLTEQEVAGSGFVRLDVYPGDATEPAATQLYAPAAIYCITPTTEAMARTVAASAIPAPVSRWELQVPSDPIEADEEFDVVVKRG